MAAPSLPYVTLEQYLAFDRDSEIDHEYIYGAVRPVEQATSGHGRIVANTTIAIGTRISAMDCAVYASSARVCAESKSLYVHPDLTVVCGKVEYAADEDTITNPKLIVEVLSPTTANYDLGPKARMYWKIATLTDLLFVDQKKVWIEYWFRVPGGKWASREYESLSDAVHIESTGIDIPVAEIYAGVELEA